MEELLSYIFAHSNQVVLLVTAMLLLSGLNFPISEDVVLISCGAIVCDALILTQLAFYGWLFIVCWVSAWEAYALGRALGPRLFRTRILRGTLTPERVGKMQRFYNNYGFMAMMIGRFIPFGVRNALFMTAGLSKISFPRFILQDFLPCMLSSALLFSLGVYFGKNSDLLYEYLIVYQSIIGTMLALALVGGIFWLVRKRRLVAAQRNGGIISQ